MTATTTTALPKNKTGLFAGDTLQEVKPTRNHLNTIPALLPHYRHTGSANVSLALSEQNRLSRTGIQPYLLDGNSSVTDNSALTVNGNGIRNSFRPSTVRRQKLRVTTAMTHRDKNYRDTKNISSKQLLPPSPASARLKSEIDQINSKLKIHEDLKKILQLQHNRDMAGTPSSALSYSTTNRLSSASTSNTAGRIHQRFSSAITNNTLTSIQGLTDKSLQTLSSIAAPSSPYNEEDSNQNVINNHVSHAYQIPQQSNVGSGSIFPLNPAPPLSSNKTHSTKPNRRYNGNKSIACPFYVMYFTNLAMQQRQNNNETNRTPSSITTTTTIARQGTMNSRISTSYSRHQSTRRQVHSPISVNTSSAIDDDNDSMINTTSYYNHKRFSAKMTAFETENSNLLKDVLRTTSWNHVQV